MGPRLAAHGKGLLASSLAEAELIVDAVGGLRDARRWIVAAAVVPRVLNRFALRSDRAGEVRPRQAPQRRHLGCDGLSRSRERRGPGWPRVCRSDGA